MESVTIVEHTESILSATIAFNSCNGDLIIMDDIVATSSYFLILLLLLLRHTNLYFELLYSLYNIRISRMYRTYYPMYSIIIMCVASSYIQHIVWVVIMLVVR